MMNKQLFIVMVWAIVPYKEENEIIFLGDTPVLADGQEVALKPAIDELTIVYNMSNTEKLPPETSFFATIKTSYRGMYFDPLEMEEDN
jgi:hypothetical protein